MIWIPLALLAITLLLAHVSSAETLPSAASTFLAAVFAGAAVWLIFLLFTTVDLLQFARDVTEGGAALAEAYPRHLTTGLAAIGLLLGFVGGGSAAGRVFAADPQGPLVSLTVPVMVACAGVVLVLAALLRI